MIFKVLVGLAVAGVSIGAIAGTASAAAPGAVVVTTGQGVEFFPPVEISVDTPPPLIAIDGVLRGFHVGGT